ncbi:tRNA (adenosine(37)-N6)-threonylcarbamoyltransferase complex transferase subunit TsaD [Candidatus Kaiserbacteria bacterium CG10_big_fil_rev_8_21_14_0_10_59_10]|uniref:tRNA N6-adenosine threonylcarbamoyltransferase n=1 Tax=Candidatus Kaiserbacteria bacterium CG10_big_fil_rev_8_21_14_0_10_59_10 TaxID=1974612 RepID=A0A2H0U7T7_9BACT|nr:MAG: tRNA (adenosine(37)-N6)-threonylcarbamoyltransferase complex transferase subunit TsaD [Candidatus Kaiserbacteria bacterium CG10_big_fil_rev_8_21_14_0_10_59_10]
MRILGIETSADDTGIALIDASGTFGPDFRCSVLANELASQNVHAAYGGIYPNLAKREHAKNLPILLTRALSACKDANVDAIAVTVGPGLEPCLWQGIEFAKRLGQDWGVPLIPVNHMEGHILVSLLQQEAATRYKLQAVSYPAIVLLISGGHTELILMRGFGGYEYLGRTRDDAVGEAFDKVARMLDLPYPGGPHISRLAEAFRATHEVTPRGLPSRGLRLPRPMLHDDNYDFSFAGLKTAVLRLVDANKPLTDDAKMLIAREFEDAAAEVLAAKTARAANEYGAATVIVGGGVSANAHIRGELSRALQDTGCELLLCPLEFSGDNALMIALAGCFRSFTAVSARAGAPRDMHAREDSLRAQGYLKLTDNA